MVPSREPHIPRLPLTEVIVRATGSCDRDGDPEDSKMDGELKVVANLIRNRVPVDPGLLADEDVDLH